MGGYDEPFLLVTTVLSVIAELSLVPWAGNAALESVKVALALWRAMQGPSIWVMRGESRLIPSTSSVSPRL